MKIILLGVLLVLSNPIPAQVIEAATSASLEQNLEELSEQTETESEDEYELQQLAGYVNAPLNINAREEVLIECPLLSTLQIQNLLKYRQLLGDLISVYELQAVPGFTIKEINALIPYLTISGSATEFKTIREKLTSGDRSFIVRPSRIPEKSKGFSGEKKYLGGREKLLLRYTYKYRDLLQYGLVADQDAGEPFVFHKKQIGFDFYSFHLFARRIGIIKSLAIGDYTINLGQGLIHWQSQAFKKSSGVINIKRQNEVLRPYHSAGEYNFLRGCAVTFKKGRIENTLFVSLRQLSAHTEVQEILGEVFGSVQTSGLHRTEGEIADKNKVRMFISGGNLKWNSSLGHIGINAVRYRYSHSYLRRDLPYNLFSIKGTTWVNYSTDFSYTFRNFHFFGELASDRRFSTALSMGVMASLDASVDIALLFRRIDPEYQSLFGNAFTENTMPSNENGFYAGISLKPQREFKIDIYGDVFSFPWLRYRADAPGYGTQYLFQLSWLPSKKIEVYTRFRFKIKPLNQSGSIMPINYPEDQLLRNWRTAIHFQLNRNVLLRSRLEFCWFGVKGKPSPETGFLFYSDVLYKQFGKKWSVSGRIQVFETSGYNTRLYAYENDVLFSSTTSSFFDKGSRLYLNAKVKLKIRYLKKTTLDLGLKASTSLYSGIASVGSGYDEIQGNHRSELKFQVLFSPGG